MPGAEGRSLLPLLAHVARPPWRHDFLVEHLGGPPQRAVPTYCAVRVERYTYVLYRTREEELYDLLLDAHELDNVAAHPAMQQPKDRLRARLERLCRPPPPRFTAFAARP